MLPLEETGEMSLDGFNAAVLVRELEGRCRGARLQKFSQLTEHDFLLHLRSPGRTDRLLISLHPDKSRFHFIDSTHPAAIVPNSFVMLGRKHVGGTRLLQVVQAALDRKVSLLFASGYQLVFDWAGRPSALLLLNPETRTVAGAYPSRGRFRTRETYPEFEPSALLSLDPDSAWLKLQALPPDLPLGQGLDELASDWSPLWKKRFAERAQARTIQDLEEDLFQATWSRLVTPLKEGGPFCPGIAPDGELTYVAGPPTAFNTYHEAAHARWLESSVAPGVADFRQDLLKKLRKNRDKSVRKLAKRRDDRKGAESAPQDQLKGDLLLAYAQGLKRGTERFETADWEGHPLVITLDPRLGPNENAERYYNKAKKKRRALSFLEEQIALAQEEVEMWDDLIYAAESSDDRTDLEQVKRSLPSTQGVKKRRLPEAPSSGPRRFRHNDFLLLVGRNPIQNEQLSFKTAAKDDHWFHVRQGAGSHVVLKTAGREPPQDTVKAAAWLAGKYSHAAGSLAVAVITTRARFLRKPKDGSVGKALYRQETEIVVDPTSSAPEGLSEETKNGASP